MNYRHAFHAGGFADVFKHLVIARILVHLRDKPTPFRVIDTHGGDGLYDLGGEEANCTGEWRHGIGRLANAALPDAAAGLIAPYLAVVSACNGSAELRYYPGSPLLVRDLLRPQDRLIACELAPLAAQSLARHLRGTEQAKVMRIDGWLALNAFVPAKERRGLVIVDPPYEQPDEVARLADRVISAFRKWPTGIYLIWYPLTGRVDAGRLALRLRQAGVQKSLRAELTVGVTPGEGILHACGVMLINPPWKLAAELEIIGPLLARLLGNEAGGSFALDPGPA